MEPACLSLAPIQRTPWRVKMNYNLDDFCTDFQEDQFALQDHALDAEGDMIWLEFNQEYGFE
jgi:hypothetical protein